MVTFYEWVTLNNRHGGAVTYGQAFLAVDFLIERKGPPSVVEYFRLFGESEDRLANFQAAFGWALSAFEREFGTYLDGAVSDHPRLSLADLLPHGTTRCPDGAARNSDGGAFSAIGRV